MKLDIHSPHQPGAFSAEVDPNDPPSVVRAPGKPARQVYLNWDQAFDDQGHLRRCPVCGCRDLYLKKDFPQLTTFGLVVLAAVIGLVLFGFEQVALAIVVCGLILVADAVIFLFAKRYLVCYQCESSFRQAPIGPHHEPWRLSIGERYTARAVNPTEPGDQADQADQPEQADQVERPRHTPRT